MDTKKIFQTIRSKEGAAGLQYASENYTQSAPWIKKVSQ